MKMKTTTMMMKMKMSSIEIKGIGSDVVEIDRVRKLYDRFGENFLHRILTDEERAYCKKHADPVPRIAGRFAAKEAVVKALGQGFGEKISWQDIAILPSKNGKPEVALSPRLQKTFGNPHILLTLSHSKTIAMAWCLWT